MEANSFESEPTLVGGASRPGEPRLGKDASPHLMPPRRPTSFGISLPSPVT